MSGTFRTHNIRLSLLLIFGGGVLLFCLWGWAHEPNLHRIRAALIYKRVALEALADPQAGKITAENRAPAAIRALTLAAGAQGLNTDGNFQKALRLAQLLIYRNYPLLSDAKTGPAVKLNQIRSGSTAFCSDYTEAFVGLCAAAGIPAREWGITADELKGPRGHSLVEIYDRPSGTWWILDPFVGGWPSRIERSNTGIGIYDYLREAKGNIAWHAISDADLRWKPVKEVYNAAQVSLFLIAGQRIFEPIAGPFPEPVRQSIKIVTGRMFHFLFPSVDRNRKLLEGLLVLRISILGVGISGGLAFGSLCLFFTSTVRSLRRRQKTDAARNRAL